MNKKELSTLVLLLLLIPVWLFMDARFIKPLFPEPVQPIPTPATSGVEVNAPGGNLESGEDKLREAPTAGIPKEVPVVLPLETIPADPMLLSLTNDVMRVVVSNFGGGIQEVYLSDFPENLEDSSPVRLDFSSSPALVYDAPGLTQEAPFQVETDESGRQLALTRILHSGLRFRRELVLQEGSYVVKVKDTWMNPGVAEEAADVMSIWLGRMFPRPEASETYGPYLGVDVRHTGGIGMKHYVKDIVSEVGKRDEVWEHMVPQGLDWIGVKNKFFTQVLTPMQGDSTVTGAKMRARKGEGDAKIGMVQAGVVFGRSGVSGGGSLVREYTYYVGPISQENLRPLGLGQEEVIDYRLWRVFVPIGKILMSGLTGLHRVTGNWGWSIILLTFVVRLLFWPIMQKGQDNMKRMSKLSPQMKELREKHKNNPEKLNRAMAEFYKEHKINPMAGCAPMFLQIPVFIALYGTLRVATELRFAEFLWIRDLSEPERLYELFGVNVNLLPLSMGATMIWQQRMTPSAGMDEQQRKIMMMMPIVFLFFSYNMPAGLLLYWNTSNLISIYQAWHSKRREAAREASVPAAPLASPPAGKKKPKGPAKKG